jgi:N-dimethylarginine dimethylaminohydrolase
MYVQRLLLAAPDDFDVRYAINPLTELTVAVDQGKARTQWQHLYDVLVGAGATLTVLPSAGPRFPDYVFAANHAVVIGSTAILSRFRSIERRGEEEVTANWLLAHGYTIHRLPDGMYFEGEGDCVWSHDHTRLWIGYGAGRTTRAGAEAVRAILRKSLNEAIDIQLLHLQDTRFYHLDLCLRPLPTGQCLWRAGAFSPAARETLRRAFGSLIDVPDRWPYLCNSSIVGRTLLVPRSGAEARAWLRSRVRMPIREINVSEFQKAGGALRCMILPVFAENEGLR